MSNKTWIAAAMAVLMLGACSGRTTDLQRGVIGGAAGAAAAEATENDPLVGAAVGAGAGVACDDVGACR